MTEEVSTLPLNMAEETPPTGNSKFKNETIITTPRLRIRPLRTDDVEFIWTARQFREIYKWTHANRQWLDKQFAQDWIKNALNTPTNYNFIIEIPPQVDATPANETAVPSAPNESNPTLPTTIGSIGLFGDYELGYLFHPDYWGKGYATEAVGAFIKAVDENLPECERITAQVDTGNVGSMGVMRKVGFVEVRREEYENATMGKREEVVFEYRPPAQ